MKNLLKSVALIAGLSLPVVTSAAPYCAALANLEDLPTKYQKRGPFYSDADAGWIVSADQLKSGFMVSQEAVRLWQMIAAEFERRGTELVVLAAPPRPLFVPEESSESLELKDAFDRGGMARNFSAYIAALNAAGILAPDLSVLAGGEAAGDYYFKRDTHWTPVGAALSAAHLRQSIDGTPAGETLQSVPFSASYQEKGSLSHVAEQACGARPLPETAVAPVFAKAGSVDALLSDTFTGPRVALVGTSFSNRYQRDAYQVADALAHALDADVKNYAIAGGGLAGSMSGFIQSGALESAQYEMVVWETPYTAPLTQVDGLRQILGEMLAQSATNFDAVQSAQVGNDWLSIGHEFSLADHAGLQIIVPGQSTGTLTVELIDEDGEKTRIKLTKSDRADPALRTDSWGLAFGGLAPKRIERIKLRLLGEAAKDAQVRLFN
ncbi:hypothetical protein [uncultured Roseobacter sp.]|uniref:alginate O-acetyltransferase AlgX-related protein n=1 Tax=uncultured Roseobacter sp. TaxID=114847 RepID=UPI002635CBAB|nr:hypothetical protein [uncultured Roseobacter sp.]